MLTIEMMVINLRSLPRSYNGKSWCLHVNKVVVYIIYSIYICIMVQMYNAYSGIKHVDRVIMRRTYTSRKICE